MSAPLNYGAKSMRNILIGWGSTWGALKEAVDLLNADSQDVSLVHFNQVWPLNSEYFYFLNKAEFVCVVENNFRGQFARLISGQTGRQIKNKINKFNGLPFTAREIVGEYKRLRIRK